MTKIWRLPLPRFRPSWSNSWLSLKRKESSWKPNDWNSVRSMILRCSVRWAIRTVLRTILVTWMGAAKVSHLIPCLISSQMIFSSWLMKVIWRWGRLKGCTMVTARGRKCWSIMVSACRLPWTIVRCVGKSLKVMFIRLSMYLRHRVTMSENKRIQ